MGSGPKKKGTRTATSAGASSVNCGRNASAARMADHRQPSAIRKRQTAAKPKPVPDETDPPQERGPEPLADRRGEDPPPHLAAAVAAAAAARAAAARIRATRYGIGGENRVEVRSAVGEKLRPLSSPRQKSPNLGRTAPPIQPGTHSVGKPTDLDTSPRFARTMSIARQVLEKEGKSGFWHLQLLKEQDEPTFWCRLAGWHRARHAVFPPIERNSSGRPEAAVTDRRSHGELRPEQTSQLASHSDTASLDNTRELGEPEEGPPAGRHGAPSDDDQASIGLEVRPATIQPDAQHSDILPAPSDRLLAGHPSECKETTFLSSTRALVPVKTINPSNDLWNGEAPRLLTHLAVSFPTLATIMVERLPLAQETGDRYSAASGPGASRRAPHRPPARNPVLGANATKRPQGVCHAGAGSDSASLRQLEPMVDVANTPRPERASRRYLTIGATLVAGTMLGTLLGTSLGALYPRDRDLLEQIARSWSTFAPSVEFGSRNAVENNTEPVSAAQPVALGKPESANGASQRVAEGAPAIGSLVEGPPDVPIAERRKHVDRPDDRSQLVPADSAAGSESTAAPEARRPQPQWQALYALGHKQQQRGDLAAASGAYRRAAELNPTHSWIFYDWGYVLALQGDQAGAVAKYRRAIELNPKHPYAYYDLGYLLHLRGDDEGAINNFETASQLNPTNPFVYYDLGQLLEKRGELDHALRIYRKAVEVGPTSRAGHDSQRRIVELTRQQ